MHSLDPAFTETFEIMVTEACRRMAHTLIEGQFIGA
jgi:hypothetical protein